MSRRTPIGLAVLSALLLLALWLGDRLAPGAAQLATRALSPLAATQVLSFQVHTALQTCELARGAAGGWRFSGAFAEKRADSATIDAALAELELATQGGLVADTAPDARHGLAAPALLLTLRTRDGQVSRIRLGADAGRGRTFVAHEERLFVVPTRVVSPWGRGCQDLIDLRVLEWSSTTVRKIRIGEVWVVRSAEDADWRVSPHDARADPARVNELQGVLATLREPDRAPGAGLSVEVTDHQGQRAAHVNAAAPVAARLRALAARLASDQPIQLRAATVQRIELRQGPRRLLLARTSTDDGWEVGTAPAFDAPLEGARPAEGALVRRLLAALMTLRAESSQPSPAPAPSLDAEALHLRVADDRHTLRLEARMLAPGKRLLSVEGFGARYVVPEALFATLDLAPHAWRQRALWVLPPAAIDAIVVGEVELRRDADFHWQRVRPSAGATDPQGMRALVTHLARPPVLAFAVPSIGPPSAHHVLLKVETVDGTQRRWHVARIVEPATARGHAAHAEDTLAYLPTEFWARVKALTQAPPTR